MIEYKNKITVKDYNHLRASVGWAIINPSQAEIGLKNTSFLTVCYDDNQAIGMARVIWDGAYTALIADVIVHPHYQKQHIGSTMLQQIMDFFHGQITSNQTIMITLAAAKGKESFYKKFGFLERPTERYGAGMTQTIKGI